MKNKNAFMAFTSVVNEYDLDQMQYDALWDLLDDNQLLKPSPVASKNMALKTDKQNVIGAINELLDKIKTQDLAIVGFEGKIKDILGDISSTDEDAWEILKSIDTNVITAIVRIWTEMGGLEEDIDISDIGASIKESLKNLNDKINGHEERITALEESISQSPVNSKKLICEEPTLDEDNNNKIILSKTPTNDRIIMVVNGVEYDEGDDFEVCRVEKCLYWNSENGFDIDETDELDVTYYTLD